MSYRKFFACAIVGATFVFFSGCSKCSKTPSGRSAKERKDKQSKRPSYGGISVKRVVTRDLAKGQGATVGPKSIIRYNYTTWIYDPKMQANKGQKVNGGDEKPVQVALGTGKLIRGIDQGVQGMKKGGKRQLIIPPEHAYGQQGLPPHVFPGAIILAEIEVIDVR